MNSESKKPKWLKRIQENSWEPELLISIGAFFSLFALSDNFLSWFFDVRSTLDIHLPGLAIIVFALAVALEGIKILFLIHLLIRAYWTGLIGFSYAFPQGLHLSKKDSIHPRFLLMMEDAFGLDKYIEKIERTASLIFGVTIRFVLTFIGIATLMTLISMVAGYLPILLAQIFVVMILSFLLLYLVDMVTKMSLRKSRVAIYYYPIYRLMDLITLSIIFRPISQLINTNISPKKSLPLATIIISIAFLFAYQDLTPMRIARFYNQGNLLKNIDVSDVYLRQHYLNTWEKGDFKPAVQIGQDIVAKSTTLLVFVEYQPSYDAIFEDQNESPLNLKTFKDGMRIRIDKYHIELEDFVVGKNPKTNRVGLIGYVNTNQLKTGIHFISVEYKESSTEPEIWKMLYPQKIPFWIN